MKKFNLKALVVCALLAAISFVFGKFLAVPPGSDAIMRFSFENTPLFIAGFLFGPIYGCLTAVVADLIGGFILYGGSVNPIITLGAAAIGFMGGLLFLILKKLPLFLRVLLAVLLSNIIGSIILKTIGIATYSSMPYIILLLWRCLNYVIMTAIDTLVLYFLFKNKSFRNITESLK